MFRIALILPLLMVVALSPAAAEFLQPDPSLSPERVVEIQLQSLQRNDVPTPDAGIEQTWAFAHPDNKRVTGPLERFSQMIKGPSYRMLLGHREHSINPAARTDQRALFSVSIVTVKGQRISYLWELAKVASGALVGAWMTVHVSPPLRAGDTI